MTPSLYLRRFAMPLNDAWQAEQVAKLTCSERARFARISRPQRRAQFVIAHYMLREALLAGGFHDASIEVDAEGRLQVHASATLYASIAHSADAVLRAWVTAEARLKAGQNASARIWLSRWQSCQLAVAGVSNPPLTGVFDGMTGIYNVAEFKWDAV